MGYNIVVDGKAFVRAVVSTWVIGAILLAGILLYDYDRYNSARTKGIARVKERSGALDTVLKEISSVVSTVPLGSGTTDTDAKDFRARVDKWEELKSRYEEDYAGAPVYFYAEASDALAETENALSRFMSEAYSMVSLTDNMAKNYSQSRLYESQARRAEINAGRVNDPYFWLTQSDLYLQAQGYYSAAVDYDRNAKSIQNVLTKKNTEVREDANKLRKRLADARVVSEKRANKGYFVYLYEKARKFNLLKALKRAFSVEIGPKHKYVRTKL